MSTTVYTVTETSAGSHIWTGDGLTMEQNAGEWRITDGGLNLDFRSINNPHGCPPSGIANWDNANYGAAADASLEDVQAI